MGKTIITHLIALYLGAGIFGGAMLYSAMPALNIFGAGIQAVMWPAMVYCVPKERNCNPLAYLPEWTQQSMFTFNRNEE